MTGSGRLLPNCPRNPVSEVGVIRSFCVIGGGLTGMVLASKLARDGHAVTVVEAAPQLGGLSTWHDYGGFYWDRFYHVILPSDRNLIAYLDEIGLSRYLEWRRTYTGFYLDGVMHSISSNIEFLKFPLLSLPSKMRLAWTLLYCSRINDWRSLEQETVEQFLLRVSGPENYHKLWKPLLLAKLGENYKRVSAVFIWSYIKRMFSARDTSASAEQLGHVSGGYKMVLDKVESQIRDSGGNVQTGTRVFAVDAVDESTLRVETESGGADYDHVVVTSPVGVLRRIVSPDLLRVNDPRADVEYLGVLCPVVVSSKPLVPYYVVNIADRSLPFTGMIGMSTVVDVKNTDSKYLTYLPKYVLSTDPLLDKEDAEIEAQFMSGARRMLPDLDASQIESVHVNRAVRVQPLQVLGYSDLVPEVRTRHAGLFALNTSQFVNATLNNNEVVGMVNAFYAENSNAWQSRAAF